ncbi:hypothetical protein [Humibacter ginsengiterrae]
MAKRNNLQCPTCRASGVDSGTEVSYTRTSIDHTRITRQRRCLTDPAHVFLTDERLRVMTMDRLWVRQTGGQRLSPFSLARLGQELQRDTLGLLGAEDIHKVVEDVVRALSEQLEVLASPLTSEELEANKADAGSAYVDDVDIVVEVERRLSQEEKLRTAHVTYSLGRRGQLTVQRKRPGFEGFKTAADFLEWLCAPENYPNLSRRQLEPKKRPVEVWWPSLAIRPAVVVKKSGERRDFNFVQFKKSIANAMRGRPHWGQNHELVAEFALAQLAGQRQVHSTQLSSGVTAALRRIDDIAYLRWVTVSKRLSTVSHIADEAEDLLLSPSPKLTFDQQYMVRNEVATPVRDRQL